MANTGFTYNDDEDEYKEENVLTYIGDNIYKNSLVLYVPNKEYFGVHRKNIWEVKNLNGSSVRLENIANGDSFTTTVGKLLSVDILESWGLITDKYISKASLIEYRGEEREKTASGLSYKTIYTDEKVNTNQTERKEKTMNKINFSGTVQRNTSAAREAALIVAGGTLNAVIADKVKSQLPRKYRKLAEHPLADVVIANIAGFAVQNFAKSNYKARLAADAMMNAAMVDFLQSFNIEKMISEVLANVDLSDFVDATSD